MYTALQRQEAIKLMAVDSSNLNRFLPRDAMLARY